ncbi:hypothetical protein AMTRI_Chr10g1880 [Amborella trichopoda]
MELFYFRSPRSFPHPFLPVVFFPHLVPLTPGPPFPPLLRLTPPLPPSQQTISIIRQACIRTKEEHKPSPSMVVGFSLGGSISLVLIVIIVTVVLVKRRMPRCIRSSIPIGGPPKKLAIVVCDSTSESFEGGLDSTRDSSEGGLDSTSYGFEGGEQVTQHMSSSESSSDSLEGQSEIIWETISSMQKEVAVKHSSS